MGLRGIYKPIPVTDKGVAGGVASLDAATKVEQTLKAWSYVFVYNSVAQAIPNNVMTTLNFDSELFDNDGWHSPTVNNSRVTVPTGRGGAYWMRASCRFAPSAAGSRRLVALTSFAGALVLAQTEIGPVGATTVPNIECTLVSLINPGDYVEVQVLQDSGAALNARAGWAETGLEVAYLGPA